MSEEDGLLLNFSYDSAPSKPATERAVPAVARYKPEKKKTQKQAPSGDQRFNNNNDNRNKRRPGAYKRKEDEDGDEPQSKRAKNDALDANTFVSSLFSSNPEPTKSINISDAKQLEASNAPMSDSITFEALGIDARLSEYLSDKMRLKTPTKIQRAVIPKLLNSEQDLFIQAQTGSGKTLSFCLPIFHALMNLSKPITRESGLFAIILAPSRELASQIYSVLEQLNKRYVKIVPGIVIGGEKKKSEKARIRKGVNILVSTPGRLLDHLNSTKNLNENLSLIKWLILDEGDKLMELGFEETLKEIINKIEESSNMRRSLFEKTYPELPKRRINVLCSATLKSNVKKLGEISLNNPKLVTSGGSDNVQNGNTDGLVSVPDQLQQDILVVSPKLRLVSLAGILKNVTKDKSKGSRTIVFLSCSDSVNFHFDVFTRNGKEILTAKNSARKFIKTKHKAREEEKDQKQDDPKKDNQKKDVNNRNVKGKTYKETQEEAENTISTAMSSPVLNPNTVVYRLHGMLPQHIRTSTLQHFIKGSDTKHSVLFCTDVVSRGLDLPLISTVVEYDPSFAIDDHLHRVGRTARAGHKGRSVLFLLPGDEEKYIERLKKHHLSGFNMLNHEQVLKSSFEELANEASDDGEKKKAKKWDVEATTWHLSVERWLLEDSGSLAKAQQAFVSHIRAYATHLSTERDCFNVKTLHLGHLAKSFGLRETPKKLGGKYGKGSGDKRPKKEDPRKKMLRMASMALKSQSSEFNFM